MDSYLELQLLPDPEFPPDMLMNALFAKLHRALVSHSDGRIGISFPDVGKKAGQLGQRLRLHGQAGDLEGLMASNWLQGMRDHVRFGELQPVPTGCLYRAVSRVQVDSNPERLRRRLMRRHNLDASSAIQRIPDKAIRHCTLPWVDMHSQSSGQSFRLFIGHGPLQASPTSGTFSSYGLSRSTTVPWF